MVLPPMISELVICGSIGVGKSDVFGVVGVTGKTPAIKDCGFGAMCLGKFLKVILGKFLKVIPSPSMDFPFRSVSEDRGIVAGFR
jgi:hypothetical protein